MVGGESTRAYLEEEVVSGLTDDRAKTGRRRNGPNRQDSLLPLQSQTNELRGEGEGVREKEAIVLMPPLPLFTPK